MRCYRKGTKMLKLSEGRGVTAQRPSDVQMSIHGYVTAMSHRRNVRSDCTARPCCDAWPKSGEIVESSANQSLTVSVTSWDFQKNNFKTLFLKSSAQSSTIARVLFFLIRSCLIATVTDGKECQAQFSFPNRSIKKSELQNSFWWRKRNSDRGYQ